MSNVFFKKLARTTAGLCRNCGKKPCHCKIPKLIRRQMPEILRRKRVGGKKVQ